MVKIEQISLFSNFKIFIFQKCPIFVESILHIFSNRTNSKQENIRIPCLSLLDQNRIYNVLDRVTPKPTERDRKHKEVFRRFWGKSTFCFQPVLKQELQATQQIFSLLLEIKFRTLKTAVFSSLLSGKNQFHFNLVLKLKLNLVLIDYINS